MSTPDKQDRILKIAEEQYGEELGYAAIVNFLHDPEVEAILSAPSAIGALTWEHVEYDETDWSSEPRPGNHWLDVEHRLLTIVTKDGKIWRLRLPRAPTDGGGA